MTNIEKELTQNLVGSRGLWGSSMLMLCTAHTEINGFTIFLIEILNYSTYRFILSDRPIYNLFYWIFPLAQILNEKIAIIALNQSSEKRHSFHIVIFGTSRFFFCLTSAVQVSCLGLCLCWWLIQLWRIDEWLADMSLVNAQRLCSQ